MPNATEQFAADVQIGDQIELYEKLEDGLVRAIFSRVYGIYHFNGAMFFRTRKCTVSCFETAKIKVIRNGP